MINPNYISDPDILTRYAIFYSLQCYPAILSLVELFISPTPHDVIPCFFDHCDGEDKDKRSHVGKQESDSKGRNELTESNKQEEQVEEELKLVDEHDGNESNDVVLLIANSILFGILILAELYLSLLNTILRISGIIL